MVSDWSKTPENILKDLIASVNPKFNTHRDKYTLGTPTPLTLQSRNTAVVLTPKPGVNVINPTTIRYNRIPISAVANARIAGLTVTLGAALSTLPSTATGLLPKINSWLGLGLGPNDIVATNITSGLLGVLPIKLVTVTPASNNLLFIGSVVLTVKA